MALDVKIISSWRNHCRLCLLDEGIMAPLFDGEGLNRQIGHKIEKCLQLVSYDGDPLPTKICHKCLYKIDQAYEFRTMALNSYERIKSHLLPLKHVPNVEEYLKKAGHLKMSDLDDLSFPASSTRGQEAKIRVKTETELMGDAQSSSWPPNLESPFSSTPKPSSSREPTTFENHASSSTHHDNLKRKRFSHPPDSTSLEAPERNLKKVKTKHSLAGPASRKRQVQSSQWNCVFCLSSFSSKASLNTHLEKCLRCGVCQKDFSSFQEKVIHEAVHISIPVDCEVKHLRWKCTSCPARFASSTMLSTHCKDNHNFFVEPQTVCKAESESKISLDENGTSSTTFSCITCQELFCTNRMLLDHEKIIHGRFRCSSCSEVFDSLKALSSHKRCHIVTQTSIKKHFEKTDNLKSHGKMKPLSCNICYEAFDEEDSFVLHLYHHATEEQSDDESVPSKKSKKGQTGKKKKSTPTNTVVNSVGSENTSEQFSVKCEKCHVVCRSREYYKIHVATHVSKAKTRFPCSGCNQDFRNVEALNRHTCCGKQLDDLNKCCLDCGQGLVDGEDHVCDNKCPECDKVFKSARGQRLHFAHKHKRKLPTESGLDVAELDEEDVHNQSDGDSVKNQNINVESQIKVENEPPQENRTDETSENGHSDSDDCHCTDSNSSRSLGENSPAERLPPDGASVVESVPCELNLSTNGVEQSKISPTLETYQNVCVEADL